MAIYKAMILDASHESAANIKRLLERNDIQVVEWAVNGTGWISAFQQSRADFAVVDLQLPKRDGLYCIEKVLAIHSGAKIIFTHSYVGAMANEVELKAMALGASAVAQKPLVEARFEALLQRLIEFMNLEKSQLRKSTVLSAQKR